MQAVLLRTRLGVPPLPPQLLERGRLVELLNTAARSRKLTVIAAPAGYGKTILAAQWAHQARMPVGWLSADADDQDPEQFLRYLFGAWASVQPEIEDSPAGVLLSGMAPAIDAVLAEIVRFAGDSDFELALVIDDCHVIQNPVVFDALTYLLDHLPPSVHVILTGRTEPPLPLARYRAHQALAEIGVSELQFTSAESAELLCDTLGLDLPSEDIGPLTDRLEGWAAGLQLASLTLRDRGRAPPATISGRHRFIADYLRDDVLSYLSDETREFLLRTSILDRLTGALCDAVTGSRNGQETLEQLERDHLFTLPLDDNREWFRYHPLFADVLRQELERFAADEIAGLHRRAADWYLGQEMPDPAFDHALASVDLPTMYAVLDRHGLVKIFTGQFQTLRSWLDALPDAWYTQQPEIGLLRVALMLYSGQFEAGIQLLSDIEASILAAEVVDDRAMGRATAIRCFIACETNNTEQAEQFAGTALDSLPSSDNTFRSGIWGALGDVYRRNGRWSDAHAHYVRALSHTTTPAGYVQSVHAYGALADLELRQGHLHRAADYWHKAMSVIDDRRLWGAYPLPLIGWVHIRLGEILYEWNELREAADLATRGRERADLGGDPRSIIAGGLLDARLHLARGDTTATDALIEHIRPIVADVQFREWTTTFERMQVELWLAQGKLRSAVSWMDAARTRSEFGQPDTEPASLAVARVLIVAGDVVSLGQAINLLDDLASEAQEQGRIGLEIDALALRAIGSWARGERADALAIIERALRLAEPERYVRLFVDLGLPMARLLQETASRKVMTDYVRRLLGAFNAGVLAHLPAGSQLPEPLSEREVEVLHLIAAGLTNREIGDSLYISPETVKKHTVSIYGKLGVHGRTEAVSRARSIDLLD